MDAMKTICQPGAFCRVALFNLEEYESAKSAFEAGQALDAKNSTFKTWIRKCAAEMDGAHSLLPTQASAHNGFALFLSLFGRSGTLYGATCPASIFEHAA